MVDRTHRELMDDDIARIAGAYHAWRDDATAYEDLPGFCKSAPLDEVRRHGHVLTPGRYVGAELQPDDIRPVDLETVPPNGENAPLGVFKGKKRQITLTDHAGIA